MSDRAKIIAVETSGRLGSVALGEGARFLDDATFRTDHNHAVELLPSLDLLSRRHGWSATDVDYICISVGPGSFTGLRIAVTVARTLAGCTQARIVAVPTLDAIAQNAATLTTPPQHIAVIADAKRSQIYGAAFEFEDGHYHRTVAPAVFDPVEFLRALPKPVHLMGEGIKYHHKALDSIPHHQLPAELYCASAKVVYRIGYDMIQARDFTDPAQLVPIYMRLPEAEEKWRQRHDHKVNSS